MLSPRRRSRRFVVGLLDSQIPRVGSAAPPLRDDHTRHDDSNALLGCSLQNFSCMLPTTLQCDKRSRIKRDPVFHAVFFPGDRFFGSAAPPHSLSIASRSLAVGTGPPNHPSNSCIPSGRAASDASSAMTAETLPAHKRFARFCSDAKSLLVRETLVLLVTPARPLRSYRGSTLFSCDVFHQFAHFAPGRDE